jgi:hypothetical protein
MTESYDILRVTTGGEEEQEIFAQRDVFFEGVLRALDFTQMPVEQNPFVTVEIRTLGVEDPTGLRPLDDRIHQLLVCSELLAIVMDKRNDFNSHEVTFWSRRPSPECEAQMQAIRLAYGR